MAVPHSASPGNDWLTGIQGENLSMRIVEMQKHIQSAAALELLLYAEKKIRQTA